MAVVVSASPAVASRAEFPNLEPLWKAYPLMKAIFAAQFASEIEGVTERGGEALLRERVGGLDADQRAMLREALDGVAAARSR